MNSKNDTRNRTGSPIDREQLDGGRTGKNEIAQVSISVRPTEGLYDTALDEASDV